MGRKIFVIDIGKCNGCYGCQIACKDEHVGNDWTPIAKPQPDTGQFWMKMTEHVRGTVPKVKMHYISIMCMHCDNAPCMKFCPIEGAIYKRDDGLVIIDPELCTGCKSCVDVCPYGAIYFNEDLQLAQKCTGCAHLLDDGWKEPRCIDFCPTQAIRFMEESELSKAAPDATPMKPELNTNPRVYYMNMPKRFIGGLIYDPVDKEIIKGATCTLTGADNSVSTTNTDGFGDFWFENLEDGIYSLKIEADGFESREYTSLNTEKDINLGEIALNPK